MRISALTTGILVTAVAVAPSIAAAKTLRDAVATAVANNQNFHADLVSSQKMLNPSGEISFANSG